MGVWSPGPGPTAGDDTFTGDGSNEGANGGGGNDTLNGGGGNDQLNGGVGADALNGGAGNDSYWIDDVADLVTELAGEGIDQVFSSITYTLGAEVEHLILVGGAAIDGAGNALDNQMFGNSAANTLTGGDGDDTLDGDNGADTLIGGAGNDTFFGRFGDDTLVGGSGDDTYYFGTDGQDDRFDVIVELPDEGLDTIVAFGTYTLPANVENLTLIGGNAFGNSLDNTIIGSFDMNAIYGHDGDDVLDGGGERDQLVGGLGDDTFFVDTVFDIVVELPDQGVDTVISSDDFTLLTDSSVGVESLLLTGSDSINGTGNALDNTILGNTANNVLDGGAGDDVLHGRGGVDTLSGGAGNDTYHIEGGDDLVMELSGEGDDAVYVLVTNHPFGFTYALPAEVERLFLLGFDNNNGVGNALNNSLTGNFGDNSLHGAAGEDVLNGDAGHDVLDGGEGADAMSGGTGRDVYYVDNTGDTVTEGASGEVWTDLVRASITYVLPAEVEELTLLGDAAINGTGNALNNIIAGNTANNALAGDAGDDVLDGGAGLDFLLGGEGDDVLDGGADVDTLGGGSGNDTYYVDDELDVVVEAPGQGEDTVYASVNFGLEASQPDQLPSSVQVENLYLQGVEAINGSGNALDNLIVGNGAANSLHGGDGDDVLDGGGGADFLSGGLGDDTYFVDHADDHVIEFPEGFAGHNRDLVYASVTYTLVTSVEGLTLIGGAINGTGNGLNNSITGNSAANFLDGGAGDDVLDGGAGSDVLDGGGGADTMIGGLGDDAFLVDHAGDVVVELSGEGSQDEVFASVTYTLGAAVERLTLLGDAAINGAGNALNNFIIGTIASNVLEGGAGDDFLIGGEGADTMIGGSGNDAYFVDNAGDVTSETSSSGGADSVHSSVTRTLGANLEHLALTGAAAISGFGNALNNSIVGNGAANQLNGFDGNDTLNGGSGADAMFGGNGDDIYVVDNAGDVTSETSALGGTDTVMSSLTRNLTANIENLTLIGAAAITGAGNVLNNTITGNSGANTLYGFDGNDRLDGGAGADTLFGANGNDTYVVDHVGDITVEGSALGGIDTVESSISRNLNANFENLVLTGTAQFGYGNILGNVMTGNAAANGLYGFDGNDRLDGGAGLDQMFGANGDDTYVVDNAGDVTSEVSALGGVDTVESSVTRNLTAHLENLVLTGASAITGAGNALGNVITGNVAANTLYGLDGADTLDGGLGGDTLQGGTGADEYVFSTALGGGNIDAVVGFSVADDTIALDNAVFAGLALGALDADAFHIGAAAADADDRIIYDSASGALYFDADGAGGGAAVQFATLGAGLALSHSDFIISGP